MRRVCACLRACVVCMLCVVVVSRVCLAIVFTAADLTVVMQGADARRAALLDAKRAAAHSHLEAVQVKRAVVMAARAAAKVEATAMAC